MKSKRPLLSIVIPSRNRGQYLPEVLRTVLEQPYSDLEVIIADNASDDGTESIIAKTIDSRIRYERSSDILGMAENWERGLSYTRGHYVFFLGADDGMTPGSLDWIAEVLIKFKPPSLTWQKPDYTWPDASPPNLLQLVLPSEPRWINGSMILRLLAMGLTNYGLLPNIYSSFVSRLAIERVQEKQGKFFASVTPDVYSAISLMSEFSNFIFSPYPFSLSGGSGASNGMSNAQAGGLKTFFAESTQPMHREMQVVPGSISSCVLEALLTANDEIFNGTLPINRKRYLSLILNELGERVPAVQEEGLATLRSLELSKDELDLLNRFEFRWSRSQRPNSLSMTKRDADRMPVKNNAVVITDCSSIGVKNVAEACQLTSAIVGPFEVPETIKNLSWGMLVSEIAYRGSAKILRGPSQNRRPAPEILAI